jgi:hypothetical protein
MSPSSFFTMTSTFQVSCSLVIGVREVIGNSLFQKNFKNKLDETSEGSTVTLPSLTRGWTLTFNIGD